MERIYKYRGVDFTKTFKICYIKEKPVNLYEIIGIKGAQVKPYLTTIRDCREFIDDMMANAIFTEIYS